MEQVVGSSEQPMANQQEYSDASDRFSRRVYMEETHVKHKDTIPQLDLSSITVKQPSASFIQKDAS